MEEKFTKNGLSSLREKIRQWYGRPDWQNVSNYPKPGEVSLHRWAWEFLRRNSEFRADYREFQDIAKKNPWRGHESVDHPSKVALNKLNKKWGISFFYLNAWIATAPDDYDAPCFFEAGMAEPIGHFELRAAPTGSRHHVVPYDREHMVLRFNLSLPIEPQIRAARRHLLSNQGAWKENFRSRPIVDKRHRIKKFPQYLRVFDAIEQGVRKEKICEHFSKEASANDSTEWPKAINYAYKQAVRYAKSEYRMILLADKDSLRRRFRRR